MMMKDNRVLLFLVRAGIACLVIATLLFVIWPGYLNSFSGPLFLRQKIISIIEHYPGFDQDWFSVASLITVSVYIYGYLAVILITANLLYPTRIPSSQRSGRDQWSLLSYAIVGRYIPKQQGLNDSLVTTDQQSIFDVIRTYSKSREGIGSVALDTVLIFALSYIGYTALLAPPTYGGPLTRLVDGLMVGLWCYCIFSSVMWFIFILSAWFQYICRRI